MQEYSNLRVWHSAMVVARDAYQFTADLPNEERFELSRQIRRSAVSVPSNIAEGCGRDSDREFARFLRIAYASACEMETQVQLADDLGLGEREAASQVIDESRQLRAMLGALITRLASKQD